jgi:ribonuclease VapC
MIAVDASAILALVLKEADAGVFEQALALAGQSVMSPVNYWEAQVRAGAVFGEVGRQATRDVMANLGVEVGALSATDAEAAADAFARFGKGSGSGARLNLGDCFAYALAMREGDGLLYKDADFAKTDVKSALP